MTVVLQQRISGVSWYRYRGTEHWQGGSQDRRETGEAERERRRQRGRRGAGKGEEIGREAVCMEGDIEAGRIGGRQEGRQGGGI